MSNLAGSQLKNKTADELISALKKVKRGPKGSPF